MLLSNIDKPSTHRARGIAKAAEWLWALFRGNDRGWDGDKLDGDKFTCFAALQRGTTFSKPPAADTLQTMYLAFII